MRDTKTKITNTIVSLIVIVCFTTTSAVLLAHEASALGGAKDEQISHKTILSELTELEPCIVGATNSFLYPASYLSTSMEHFQANCRNKTQSLQCIKDGIKNRKLPGLIKRGLTTFHQLRNKAVRKYCSNPNSDQSKNLVNDYKCLVDKNFNKLRDVDIELHSNLVTLFKQKDLGDLELKYICCFLHNYKRKFNATAVANCPQAQKTVGELVDYDVTMICEDDEKLADKCPKMKPLSPQYKYDGKPGNSGSVLLMFMVSTLGEDRSEIN